MNDYYEGTLHDVGWTSSDNVKVFSMFYDKPITMEDLSYVVVRDVTRKDGFNLVLKIKNQPFVSMPCEEYVSIAFVIKPKKLVVWIGTTTYTINCPDQGMVCQKEMHLARADITKDWQAAGMMSRLSQSNEAKKNVKPTSLISSLFKRSAEWLKA